METPERKWVSPEHVRAVQRHGDAVGIFQAVCGGLGYGIAFGVGVASGSGLSEYFNDEVLGTVSGAGIGLVIAAAVYFGIRHVTKEDFPPGV